MRKNVTIIDRRTRRARRRRRILIARMILFFLAVALAAAALILLFGKPKVTKELTVEAGSDKPEVTDFLKKEYEDVTLISGLDDSVDMYTTADYEVVIRVSGKDYTSILHVVDTIEPVVIPKDAEVYAGMTVQPDDLAESIFDATKTEIQFAQEPDFSTEGSYDVTLVVTDEGGNSVEATAHVTVTKDTEPPVIEGVQELTVTAGNSVSYKKGVTVTDNCDENVALTVDNSEVDLYTAGDYPVTYIAEDGAGNVTEVSSVLHVTEATAETATEELVYALADKVLDEIITDDMTEYEKAEKIYWWVHENVRWTDHSPKTTWIEGAYRGLHEKTGDCYVYAMTSKCLLTRAEITNMDIEKIPAATRHYWNLIDVGEGWYHFDACRRADGTTFFYWTDERLMAYSHSHKESHNYDPSQYPEIQ